MEGAVVVVWCGNDVGGWRAGRSARRKFLFGGGPVGEEVTGGVRSGVRAVKEVGKRKRRWRNSYWNL